MLDLRDFAQLGTTNTDWLDSHHHFSFADYLDADRMGHGALRVWNDDIIAPNSGFPMHAHHDMEIITYVFDGAVTHRDSLGNLGRTEAGQVQVMSAGTGIMHSEFNVDAQSLHLFQIWIRPARLSQPPRWETRPVPRGNGGFEILASGWEQDRHVPPIGQKARLLSAFMDADSTLYHTIGGLDGYLVPAKGCVLVNGIEVYNRNGLAIAAEDRLEIHATQASELILLECDSLRHSSPDL